MGQGPPSGSLEDWVTLGDEPVPVEASLSWVVEPSSGGVVSFFGTVRDHAEGRAGVTSLEYEAYRDGALWSMSEVAKGARKRWSDLGRICLHHRTGRLGLCEISVLVVVAAPHRAEAFEAARWSIDTLKTTVPIWKYETWRDGAEWSRCSAPLDAAGPLVQNSLASEPSRPGAPAVAAKDEGAGR